MRLVIFTRVKLYYIWYSSFLCRLFQISFIILILSELAGIIIHNKNNAIMRYKVYYNITVKDTHKNLNATNSRGAKMGEGCGTKTIVLMLYIYSFHVAFNNDTSHFLLLLQFSHTHTHIILFSLSVNNYLIMWNGIDCTWTHFFGLEICPFTINSQSLCHPLRPLHMLAMSRRPTSPFRPFATLSFFTYSTHSPYSILLLYILHGCPIPSYRKKERIKICGNIRWFCIGCVFCFHNNTFSIMVQIRA